MDPSTGPIMEAAAEFLWSDELEASLNAFARNHASMFAGASVEGEHRLEWTGAHQDYQAVFEIHLEQFVSQQDFTAEEFLRACEDAVSQTAPVPGGALARGLAEAMISMSDYEYFIRMMVEAAAEAESGAEHSPFVAASPHEC